MSKYTMQVRFICESIAGKTESVGASEVDEVIELSRRKIFGTYPIFDEAYRAVIEAKILKHYYTREIGLETPGLWQLKLNTKMNEIMPYYNKIYVVNTQNFNPLYNIDITTEHKGNGTNTGSVNNTGYNLHSETPQGGLNGIDSGDYLTDATKNTGDTQTQNSSIDNFVETVKGKQGGESYAKIVREYIDSLVNVDMRVIDDLAQLFMNIY